MGSLEERLNDPGYKFWIKAGLCLMEVKKSIEKFADERSIRLHGFVKTAVAQTKAAVGICNNATVSKFKKNWTFHCCKDCDVYIKEIIKYSRQDFKVAKSNWNNSDAQYWPSEPWEMVKVYMNKGQKDFATQPNAKETDLSGLLNFIDHCYVPWVDVQNKDEIHKVRSLSLIVTRRENDNPRSSLHACVCPSQILCPKILVCLWIDSLKIF